MMRVGFSGNHPKSISFGKVVDKLPTADVFAEQAGISEERASSVLEGFRSAAYGEDKYLKNPEDIIELSADLECKTVVAHFFSKLFGDGSSEACDKKILKDYFDMNYRCFEDYPYKAEDCFSRGVRYLNSVK